jgi:hypothetical protein
VTAFRFSTTVLRDADPSLLAITDGLIVTAIPTDDGCGTDYPAGRYIVRGITRSWVECDFGGAS